MAKIDIVFNDKTYSVDESALANASAQLKSHFSTVMNGSGAVINLGGTSYNIDSAKLATARNEFVSHLGTIAGNGSKVVVGGVEYSVDSAKLQDAISDLETAFGGSVPSVSLITFYVNGTPYQAEEGMDWYSFINSEYNVDNHFEESNIVDMVVYNGMVVADEEANVVDVYSLIIANGVYLAG